MPTIYDVQGQPIQVPAKVTGAELRKILNIPPTKDIYLIKDQSDSYTRVPEYHPIPVEDQARIETLSSFASG
jgi:hypothetical protein